MEFLLMLPLMIGIAVILMRVNTAIQMSIVNQKHARAQAFHLAQNNSSYPRLDRQDLLAESGTNQMVMGVSDNLIGGNDDNLPIASQQMITRTRGLAGSEGEAQEEPEQRSFVRVRNTVSLCTQSIVIRSSNGVAPLSASTLREGFDPRNFMYCASRLPNLSSVGSGGGAP